MDSPDVTTIDTDAELKALGLAIKFARAATRLSQERAALKAGLSRNYVGTLERGVANPSYVAVAALARALGTTTADLARIADRIRRGEPLV